jgi:hypothetical protein
MQVLPDAIVINASPSQRRILRDPAYTEFVSGTVNPDGTLRPKIMMSEIDQVISRLQKLKTVIVADPAYAKRHPLAVIDRIILLIEDAAAMQRRTYPKKAK